MSDVPPDTSGPIEPAPNVAMSPGIPPGRSARRKRQAYQGYVFEVSAADNLYVSPDDVPVLHSNGRTRPIIVHQKASRLSWKNLRRRLRLFLHRLLRQGWLLRRRLCGLRSQHFHRLASVSRRWILRRSSVRSLRSLRFIPKAEQQPAASVPFIRVSQALQTRSKSSAQPLQTPPKVKSPAQTEQTQPELAQTQPKLTSPDFADAIGFVICSSTEGTQGAWQGGAVF